jgi:hypothetical protein
MADPQHTAVILQPMFFPWVGHLEQIRHASVYVHYDDVQYCPHTRFNRVRIKTQHGSQWLTVPVERPGLRPIDEVRICERTDWRKRHLRTLEQAYARAPHRDSALQLVHEVHAAGHESLADLCIASVEALARWFGLGTRFLRSSALAIDGRSTARLVALCRHLGACCYVTGHGARHYLDHERFEQAGIDVRYMAYERTPYPQLHGAFDPHVSALDLVANCGRAGRDVIASGTVGWREFLQEAAAV